MLEFRVLYSGYKCIVGYVICGYFLPVCGWVVFHRVKVFNFDEIQFINFFLFFF